MSRGFEGFERGFEGVFYRGFEGLFLRVLPEEKYGENDGKINAEQLVALF